MEDDPIPGLDGADTLADLQHGAAALMAEEVRQKPVGALHAIDLADLRPTDPAGEHLDEHLPEFERGHLHLLDHERLLLLDQDRGAGFHESGILSRQGYTA